MSKADVIEVEGKVVEKLPNGSFFVFKKDNLTHLEIAFFQ